MFTDDTEAKRHGLISLVLTEFLVFFPIKGIDLNIAVTVINREW